MPTSLEIQLDEDDLKSNQVLMEQKALSMKN